MKSKYKDIPAFQGDARNLKRFNDNSFDAVLLFGPMYHLLSTEDKIQALKEAKRVVKNGGLIFISYLMADYAIIVHGFRDRNIMKLKKEGFVDDQYNVHGDEDGLYSYVRIEDIDFLKDAVNLERVKIVAQDGPSDYMRNVINDLTNDEFAEFINYQTLNSSRPELLGASSHVMDILMK